MEVKLLDGVELKLCGVDGDQVRASVNHVTLVPGPEALLPQRILNLSMMLLMLLIQNSQLALLSCSFLMN